MFFTFLHYTCVFTLLHFTCVFPFLHYTCVLYLVTLYLCFLPFYTIPVFYTLLRYISLLLYSMSVFHNLLRYSCFFTICFVLYFLIHAYTLNIGNLCLYFILLFKVCFCFSKEFCSRLSKSFKRNIMHSFQI